jgi:hypothetical protein
MQVKPEVRTGHEAAWTQIISACREVWEKGGIIFEHMQDID